MNAKKEKKRKKKKKEKKKKEKKMFCTQSPRVCKRQFRMMQLRRSLIVCHLSVCNCLNKKYTVTRGTIHNAFNLHSSKVREQSYKTFYAFWRCKIKSLNCCLNDKEKCNPANMLGCCVLQKFVLAHYFHALGQACIFVFRS